MTVNEFMNQHNNQILTDQQLARVRSLAESSPAAGQPRLRLARHYWLKGELNEALVWVDRGLQLEPENINAYRIRANVLVGLKQTARATQTARDALQVAPRSVPAHILLVRMLLADLQPRAAQEMLDATLQLDPDPEQLQQLKHLQQQILSTSRQAETNPLDWMTRKFNRRLANVAGEEPDTSG